MLVGLQTFSQIFAENRPILEVPLTRAVAAKTVGLDLNAPAKLVIEDEPAYAWRGMLVDVARHYIPPPLLISTMDSMAAAKLNVLHLHLTDSQAFPLLLENPEILPGNGAGRGDPEEWDVSARLRLLFAPDAMNSTDFEGEVDIAKLGELGAFQPEKMYTTATLRTLVHEARLRGIRVVPEIDVPAHTLAWGNAFPAMVVNCSTSSKLAQSPSDIPALNPSKAITYVVVRKVLQVRVDKLLVTGCGRLITVNDNTTTPPPPPPPTTTTIWYQALSETKQKHKLTGGCAYFS